MTTDDEPLFEQCWHRLCAAFQKKRDVNEFDVYFQALAPFSINAVEAAVLEASRSGGKWFPKAPELFERAAHYQRTINDAERAERRRIGPDEKLIRREMPAIEAAKRKCVAELCRLGYPAAAARLEKWPMRHTAEYDEPDPLPVPVASVSRGSVSRDMVKGRTGSMQPLLTTGKGG